MVLSYRRNQWAISRFDAYLRYLPMCYDYQFDKRNSYRSRYMQLSDIAKLLPLYGRQSWYSTSRHRYV